MALHLVANPALLRLITMLKQLLDNVIAKDVLHELAHIGHEFLEQDILLIAVRGLEFDLHPAGSMLIAREFDKVAISIFQIIATRSGRLIDSMKFPQFLAQNLAFLFVGVKLRRLNSRHRLGDCGWRGHDLPHGWARLVLIHHVVGTMVSTLIIEVSGNHLKLRLGNIQSLKMWLMVVLMLIVTAVSIGNNHVAVGGLWRPRLLRSMTILVNVRSPNCVRHVRIIFRLAIVAAENGFIPGIGTVLSVGFEFIKSEAIHVQARGLMNPVDRGIVDLGKMSHGALVRGGIAIQCKIGGWTSNSSCTLAIECAI